MSWVVYDTKIDRILVAIEINGHGQYILEYEDKEVVVTAKTKRGLVLPTNQLIIVGEL